jgi:hypothetical protein
MWLSTHDAITSLGIDFLKSLKSWKYIPSLAMFLAITVVANIEIDNIDNRKLSRNNHRKYC